jgi:hypothetical protein
MNLEPQWVVGFIDGEGCFYVGCLKRKDMKLGYQIQPELTVVQHEQDIQVLHGLKSFFKCGNVTKNHETRYCWRVKNLNHFLNIIIPFFEKHPLKTKRRQEFETFRTICLKMQKKEHLDPNKINEIMALAESLRIQTDEQKKAKTAAKARREAKKLQESANVLEDLSLNLDPDSEPKV